MEQPHRRESPRLIPLTEEELAAIGAEFGVDVEEAHRLIMTGLNCLSSLGVGSEYTPPTEDRRAVEQLTEPVRLETGKKGIRCFSLIFDQERLTRLVGTEEHLGKPYLKITLRRGDLNSDQIADQPLERNESHECIALCVENDREPLLSPHFVYGVYGADDMLCALLPFTSTVFDWKLEDQDTEDIFPEGAYLRGAVGLAGASEDVTAELLAIQETIIATIADTNTQLSLGPRIKEHLSVMIAKDGFECAVFHTPDRQGVFHHMLSFSRFGLEGSGDRPLEAKRSRIRHEYLHVLDLLAGKYDAYLSKEIIKELATLISDRLFNGKSIEIVDDQHIAWPDTEVIETAFSERRFLIEEGEDIRGYPGHARDNVKELFVSMMNCYLDERYPKAAIRFHKKYGINIDVLYQKVFGMFVDRLRAKESSDRT